MLVVRVHVRAHVRVVGEYEAFVQVEVQVARVAQEKPVGRHRTFHTVGATLRASAPTSV